jgi:hypothetical protein
MRLLRTCLMFGLGDIEAGVLEGLIDKDMYNVGFWITIHNLY